MMQVETDYHIYFTDFFSLLIYTDGLEYHEPYIIRLTNNGKLLQVSKFVKL